MKSISFDAVVWMVIAGLLAAIGGLYLIGEQVGDRSSLIVSVEPPNGASPAITVPIQVKFSQPMNHDSVQSRLVIDPLVEGEMQWEENTLFFMPNRPLLSGQLYSVTVMPGVETAKGERNAHAMKWSFRTRQPSVVYLAMDAAEPQRRLRIMTLGTSIPRELFVAPSTILDFSPSPDGLQIALSVLRKDGTSEIWLVDAASGNNRQVLNCEASSCSSPTWSPDGKLLAYARNETSLAGINGPDRIWLYDLANHKTQPVYQDNQILGAHPVWSNNGRSLAFIDQNAIGIRIVDLLNRKDFFITTGYFSDTGSFSPDGTVLAYTNIISAGDSYALQVWSAQLGPDLTLTPLVENTKTFTDKSPAWSWGGQWIAFLRKRIDQKTGNQVALFNQTTGALTIIADQGNYADLKWNSSGQFILMQKYPENLEKGSMQLLSYDTATGRLSPVADQAIQGKWLP